MTFCIAPRSYYTPPGYYIVVRVLSGMRYGDVVAPEWSWAKDKNKARAARLRPACAELPRG